LNNKIEAWSGLEEEYISIEEKGDEEREWGCDEGVENKDESSQSSNGNKDEEEEFEDSSIGENGERRWLDE